MTASSINTFQVTIEKVVFEGYGLAQHDGKTIFVSKGLPGDILNVQIILHIVSYPFNLTIMNY